jgi:N-acetylated-alpha-linked acidic dipeptidase
MKVAHLLLVGCIVALSSADGSSPAASTVPAIAIFGFRDSATESQWEQEFLAVPNPKQAEEDLRILTQAPHMAGTAEDKATADFVAQKFRDAGLETQIQEYRVWINYPLEISVDVTAPPDAHMHGPTREHVDGDALADDPRVVMPFHGMSPSGDVEADVVYANYGTPDDFARLDQMHIDLHGKIIIMRYGINFRGVKVFLAQQHGAAGVLIYSDPADDGWARGDKYPNGPWRPDTGVQRGSVGAMIQSFVGDPTTPGIASLPELPDSKRTQPADSAALPKISSTPISYADAQPILEHLGGPETPREWQGALPFTYHVGPGPVRVKLHLKQDYQYRTIWDVIGRIGGSESPNDWVVAGNHRDAWVYGAVDPSSGTAAMLEAVRGIGELRKSGWKPKRTLIFCSWDAEEYGLIGSTEWGEQHEKDLSNAVVYFNMDVAVSGPNFGASSVPSLKPFIRDIARAVPSPQGGAVYDAWQKSSQQAKSNRRETNTSIYLPPQAQSTSDAPIGDLGSGSDYAVFIQHLGVPSSDIGSTGSYGVYHSAFDDFQWFKKFGDPNFLYEQQMARVFGLEALRMADTDVLPFDYEEYGKEVSTFLDAAKNKAQSAFGNNAPSFEEASQAAHKFEAAGAKMLARQHHLDQTANAQLASAERALLIPEGLPHRPWYRHAIFAPGEFTGYAAVVIPGVNEAIEQHDLERTRQQLAALTAALKRAIDALSH